MPPGSFVTTGRGLKGQVPRDPWERGRPKSDRPMVFRLKDLVSTEGLSPAQLERLAEITTPVQ